MKIGDSVVLRGTIKGVTYGEYGFPYYLVILPNGCETEFPKPYIEDLQQLDKPQPVKVPPSVAEKIEYFKKTGDWDLFQAMDSLFGRRETREWLEYKNNQETFARAWLDGYEVEEESKYIVKLKNVPYLFGILNFSKRSKQWYFSDSNTNHTHVTNHTRKELEEAGFGWVFDCPGIEIEEVE